ncbi:MAG: S8 family serine peptidase, partial [Planctomycetota bacterium]
HGVFDLPGHGTHCAGTIGARENDQGIVGICPDVGQADGGLIVGKVLGDDGGGRPAWVVEGIRWAASEGARVISLSLGSRMPDAAIYDAILEAVAAGIHVIAAAGNDGPSAIQSNQVNYPARYRETIAVAAVGHDRSITDFSSRGAAVDIAAPGEGVLSCLPGGRWARMSGTSMATPFVAAVVGLATCKSTSLSVCEMKRLLKENAEDAGSPGFDDAYGAGLIRAVEFFDSVPESPTGTAAASGTRILADKSE